MKIVRFTRLSEHGDELNLWQAERDGKHYLLYLKRGSGLEWDVLAKGSASAVSREFDRFIRNKTENVEQFGGDVEILTERPDAKSEKSFEIFLKPVFGVTLDWDNTKDVSEESEEDIEQQDFYKFLNRQLKRWKGDFAGQSSKFNNVVAVSRHSYWPTFLGMVQKAVKSQYGGRVKLYRGVFGEMAEDVLRGGKFQVKKLSSWTQDKGYAKDHALYWSKRGFWIVASHDFGASDVFLAPVRLPEFKPDPNILWNYLGDEDEFIIASSTPQLKAKVVLKSRKKLNEARMAESVARSVIAAMIEAPPKMVDEIYRWAKAQEAAHSIAYWEEQIEESQHYMEKALQQAEIARERGDLDHAEDREERAEWFREGIERDEARQVERRRDLKLYPRVRVKKWNRVSKKFKVNMSGWKYASLLRKAEPKKIAYADELFGVITVTLVRKSKSRIGAYSAAKAYWNASTSSLLIRIGGDLHGVIKHELRHWAQSYLSVAMGTKFGRPSKKIQTPEVQQRATGKLLRKLKQQGIDPDELHSLDDIEFYTDLADEVDSFEKMYGNWNQSEFPSTKADLLSVFVGAKEPPASFGTRGSDFVSYFFQTLKKHSRGKWQKAVKEISKAVL